MPSWGLCVGQGAAVTGQCASPPRRDTGGALRVSPPACVPSIRPGHGVRPSLRHRPQMWVFGIRTQLRGGGGSLAPGGARWERGLHTRVRTQDAAGCTPRTPPTSPLGRSSGGPAARDTGGAPIRGQGRLRPRCSPGPGRGGAAPPPPGAAPPCRVMQGRGGAAAGPGLVLRPGVCFALGGCFALPFLLCLCWWINFFFLVF